MRKFTDSSPRCGSMSRRSKTGSAPPRRRKRLARMAQTLDRSGAQKQLGRRIRLGVRRHQLQELAAVEVRQAEDFFAAHAKLAADLLNRFAGAEQLLDDGLHR